MFRSEQTDPRLKSCNKQRNDAQHRNLFSSFQTRFEKICRYHDDRAGNHQNLLLPANSNWQNIWVAFSFTWNCGVFVNYHFLFTFYEVAQLVETGLYREDLKSLVPLGSVSQNSSCYVLEFFSSFFFCYNKASVVLSQQKKKLVFMFAMSLRNGLQPTTAGQHMASAASP